MVTEARILLVDDDSSFRSALKLILKVQYEVQEAQSLKEARTLISENLFHLVLLDKTLPDGNGIELIPEIKTRSGRTSVIILTGDGDFSQVTRCLEFGADDYVLKSDHLVPELLIRIPVNLKRLMSESSFVGIDCEIPRMKKHLTPEHYQQAMAVAEKEYLLAALDLCNQNANEVATCLGVSRTTIFNRIRDLEIPRRSWTRSETIIKSAEA